MSNIDPFVLRCILHGFLLLFLKGCYLLMTLLVTSQTCEWVVLTALAWFALDSWWLWGLHDEADRGLVHLIARCEASLAAVRDLTMRYEAIDKKCQAATLKHLRARDATLRELNWMAFCRRCLLLEHMRRVKLRSANTSPNVVPVLRSASDGELCPTSPMVRTHSLT
jgi:hypothetical protein